MRTVHAHFRAEPYAPTAARRAVAALAPLERGTLSTVQLIVSELVTNSVRHAGLRASDAIEVLVSHDGDEVRGEVSAPGAGFVPALAPRLRLNPSGWGLWLLDTLADEWHVSRDRRTRVVFRLASRT